jgi:hypothetical protein
MTKQIAKKAAVAHTDNRVFLRPLHSMDIGGFEFPDLLLTQKEGFERFEGFYLPKLFEEICPIEDIAGERLVLHISDLTIVRNFAGV